MTSTPSKPVKRFFCTIGSVELGPMSADELRRLAAEGALKVEDHVWAEDAPRRILAGEARGLFSTDKSSMKSPSAPRAGNRVPQASATASPTVGNDTTVRVEPTIRITRFLNVFSKPLWCLLHRYQVVAVNDGEILDARFIRSPCLTEEDCRTDGILKYLESSGSFFRRLSVTDATWIRCEGLACRSWRKRLTSRPRVTIKLRTPTGKRKLQMHRRDASNVLQQLEECSRVQATTRWIRRPGLVLIFLVWVLSIVACLFLAGWIGLFNEEYLLFAYMGIFCLIGSVLLTLLVRSVFTRDETPNAPPDALGTLVWRSCTDEDRSGSIAFRSTPLGIAIKVIAAIWIAGLLLLHRRTLQQFYATASEYETGGVLAAWYASSNAVLVFSLLTLPAVALLYYGHSLISRRSPLEAGDSRMPFLYLRSFALDGRSSLQPRGWIAGSLGISGAGSFRAWWEEIFKNDEGFQTFSSSIRLAQCVHPLRMLRLLLGFTADTTEHSLAGYFGKIGPVVAIGKPGERVAETGAHREYVKNDEWKSRVLSMLDCCQGVLLQPSQTEGMNWELRAICKRVPRERILLVFPRIAGAANDYESLVTILGPLLGIQFPHSLPFSHRPVFMWFEKNGDVQWTEVSYRSPAFWIFRGDAVDLEYTLRPFLQGMHGGERESPRPVRRYGPVHWIAALILVFTWAYATGYWYSNSGNQSSFETSNIRTVSGTFPPYVIDIPDSWQEVPPSEIGVAREIVKPGVGSLRIVTSLETLDYSKFNKPEVMEVAVYIESQMREASEDNLRDLAIKSSRAGMFGDRYGIEMSFHYVLPSGEGRTNYRLIVSDDEGTVVIVLEELDGVSKAQQQETAAILSSLRRY